MQLAENLNRLGTETAFEVLARAAALEREGQEIINLGIGQPDFKTPDPGQRYSGVTRSCRRRSQQTSRCRSRPGLCRGGAGGQGHDVFRHYDVR